MHTRSIFFFSSALTLVAAAGCGSNDASTSGQASTTTTSSSSASSTAASSSSSGTGGTGGAGGAGGGGGGLSSYEKTVAATAWKKLAGGPTVSGGAKQDDLWFFDAMTGFAASGPKFSILKTTDGGATWTPSWNHDGTYFRALLFTDPMHGFAGNIGAGLSAQITDATAIYETKDGGGTWNPVTNITGPMPQGICNFNAPDATHLFGVGRANGPAHLVQSSDGGASWTSTDLSKSFSMLIDLHFTSATDGLVAGMDLKQRCSVQRTTDAGKTFTTVFTSATKTSLCWKLQFPSDKVGFTAVQDAGAGPGTFGKTVDGGVTWKEYPLPAKSAYAAIGIGFITENVGWVAPEDPTGQPYRTLDGGMTWEKETALKAPINRFRFVDKNTAYAIGGAVWKLDIPAN